VTRSASISSARVERSCSASSNRFSRDAATGQLTFVHFLKDGTGGVNGLDWVSGLAIPTDGEHVYAVSQFDAAVVTLDRDTTTGQLTFVEWLHDSQGGVDGLNYAWGVAVSPEGNQVYVAGQNDHSITQFDRDAATGQLKARGGWRRWFG